MPSNTQTYLVTCKLIYCTDQLHYGFNASDVVDHCCTSVSDVVSGGTAAPHGSLEPEFLLPWPQSQGVWSFGQNGDKPKWRQTKVFRPTLPKRN